MDERYQAYMCSREQCLREVNNSDVLFAWIDRTNTVGTLVEIGAAYACGKPIFIAFANAKLATQFYFAGQLARKTLVEKDVMKAWYTFMLWLEGK